ncbi:MAG: branched-chain amino acid ABC transporter substrate-binding protein, partial [Pseudomonadota bacterium]
GQFLLKKRWSDVAMIVGPQPQDAAYAEALRASATKLGLSVVAEKDWRFDADMRRKAAQEVPLFTQDLEGHDVLLVVDEIGDFARYILFNAWSPRPVVGSEGLVATAGSPAVEQWGAAQLQNRFRKFAERSMGARDYAAWAAARSIGEAVTRAQTAEADALRDFILSDKFGLAGFKGRPLSYRAWNGQLRQPIPLAHPRALAALAPIEGFLHERTELDTLGVDAPQSVCAAFGG